MDFENFFVLCHPGAACRRPIFKKCALSSSPMIWAHTCVFLLQIRSACLSLLSSTTHEFEDKYPPLPTTGYSKDKNKPLTSGI